uniref:Uncharacterized protein n=1 Tax=Panagrolaimus sp. ES5 TaxID=591445 RepID=A0AC34G910_9BILA
FCWKLLSLTFLLVDVQKMKMVKRRSAFF